MNSKKSIETRPSWFTLGLSGGFTALPNELLNGLRRFPLDRAGEERTLRALWSIASSMNRADLHDAVKLEGGNIAVFLSKRQLADAAGVSPATAHRARESLERAGFIEVRPGKGGRPSAYVLTQAHYVKLAEPGPQSRGDTELRAQHHGDTEHSSKVIPSDGGLSRPTRHKPLALNKGKKIPIPRRGRGEATSANTSDQGTPHSVAIPNRSISGDAATGATRHEPPADEPGPVTPQDAPGRLAGSAGQPDAARPAPVRFPLPDEVAALAAQVIDLALAGELPPEVAARVPNLKARLEACPEDLPAGYELAGLHPAGRLTA